MVKPLMKINVQALENPTESTPGVRCLRRWLCGGLQDHPGANDAMPCHAVPGVPSKSGRVTAVNHCIIRKIVLNYFNIFNPHLI